MYAVDVATMHTKVTLHSAAVVTCPNSPPEKTASPSLIVKNGMVNFYSNSFPFFFFFLLPVFPPYMYDDMKYGAPNKP